MDFQSELVLSYLEEDNTQHAFFRLVPLLTPTGDAREEAVKLWPDNGALRIVPDKGEQGSFKDRMRALGHFCLMDLTSFPADANKTRTNKNYRPEQGEPNRYILYSDTVKPIQNGPFYQLIDAAPENAAAAAESSITPWFMLRSDDVLYGPVSKEAPENPEKARQMEAMLFTVCPPDGIERVILCEQTEQPAAAQPAAEATPAEIPAAKQEQEEKPAKAEPAADEPLPIGESLTILDRKASFEETVQSLNQPVSANANLLNHHAPVAIPVPESMPKQQLAGTPLQKVTVRMAEAPVKNRVQEVVSSQWKCAKNDPPAENLPDSVKLRKVENPVETAIQSLREAWKHQSSQQQLIDTILSLPGIRSQLIPMRQNTKQTVLQTVLQEQLNDLEADRLIALVHLDQAKNDLEHFRKSAVEDAKKQVKAELKQAQTEADDLRKQLLDMQEELNALTAQRNAIHQEIDELSNCTMPAAAADLLKKAKMALPVYGKPIYLTGVSAQKTDAEQIFDKLGQAFSASGVTPEKNLLISLAVMLCVSDKAVISSAATAPIITLADNTIRQLGWENGYAILTDDKQNPVYASNGSHAAPVILMNTLDHFYDLPGAVQLRLSHAPEQTAVQYEADRWPVMQIADLPMLEAVDCANSVPISLAKLKEEALNTDCSELMQILREVFPFSGAVTGKTLKTMKRFAGTCAKYMQGGLPAAIDRTIALWLIPTMKPCEELKRILAEYPVSYGLLFK